MGLFEQQEFHSLHSVSQSRMLFFIATLSNRACIDVGSRAGTGRRRRKFQLIRARWSPLERVISRDESGSFVSVLGNGTRTCRRRRYRRRDATLGRLKRRVTEYSTFRGRILSLALAPRRSLNILGNIVKAVKFPSRARARARECAWSECTTKGEHDEHTCLGHPSSTMRRQVCGREGSLLQRADTMWAHRAGASHCPLWRLSCLSHNSTR